MSGASRIVLVRHGQTDFNLERRFQGVIDHPLNDHGREQARNAGRVLASRVLSPSAQVGVNVASVSAGRVFLVCSPLSRAFETAEIIVEEFRAAGAEVVGPNVDDRLIERAYGDFEGLTIPEALSRYEDEVEEWRQTGECVAAGIERSDLVGIRVRDAAIAAAEAADEGATLVVVSHGSAVTRGLLTFIGLNPLEFDQMRGLDNCHWSELVRMGGGGSGASGPVSWRLAAHNIGHREDVLGA
ncbi:histidine phosphatase family protein [Actinomyces culturomici]|uniref:histidine phosphatase family protein n=1 Tax=Actinomyces culturomici TaxID=1926276 RepID=UPI000E2096C0|nr:histidine phosphatase family protein [Actinomyces culturomici]